MLAFYMDHNIPAALTNGLRRYDIDVLTAFEDGFDKAQDPSVFDRAQELGRVLVTHDRGFLGMAASWQRQCREFAGLVFAHQSGFNVGRGIRFLRSLSDTVVGEEMYNRVLYLPTHSE